MTETIFDQHESLKWLVLGIPTIFVLVGLAVLVNIVGSLLLPNYWHKPFSSITILVVLLGFLAYTIYRLGNYQTRLFIEVFTLFIICLIGSFIPLVYVQTIIDTNSWLWFPLVYLWLSVFASVFMFSGSFLHQQNELYFYRHYKHEHLRALGLGFALPSVLFYVIIHDLLKYGRKKIHGPD